MTLGEKSGLYLFQNSHWQLLGPAGIWPEDYLDCLESFDSLSKLSGPSLLVAQGNTPHFCSLPCQCCVVTPNGTGTLPQPQVQPSTGEGALCLWNGGATFPCWPGHCGTGQDPGIQPGPTAAPMPTSFLG